MKNILFFIITICAFAIFSIITFVTTSVYGISFWLPYGWYAFVYASLCTYVGIDILFKKVRLSTNFLKYITFLGYAVLQTIVTILYLVIRTENITLLIIPNAIICLLFVIIVCTFTFYKVSNQKQEKQTKEAREFAGDIAQTLEQIYIKEKNPDFKEKILSLKNQAQFMTPCKDNSLKNLEKEILKNCLRLENVFDDSKQQLIDEISAQISQRNSIAKK